MKNYEKKYFDELTGVRAISALMVGFFHIGFSKDLIGEFAYSFQANLNVGVSIFFCLSGFLLTYRYYDNIEYSKTWFLNYFKNRIARIYPVYFMYCLFILLVKREGDILTWLLQFTLMPGLLKPEFQYISQAWSLTVEEMFYMYLPLLLMLFKNKKYHFALLIPYIIGGSIFYIFRDIQLGIFNFNSLYDFFRNTLFGRIFEFFSGAVLALFYIKNSFGCRKKKFHTILSLVSMIVILSIMAQIRLSNFETNKEILFLFRIFVMPFSIIYLFYSLISEENLITKFLSNRAMVLLGKSSYVYYLIHLGPISGILYDKFGFSLLLGHLFLWTIAILVYKFWEEPMNEHIRKLF